MVGLVARDDELGRLARIAAGDSGRKDQEGNRLGVSESDRNDARTALIGRVGRREADKMIRRAQDDIVTEYNRK